MFKIGVPIPVTEDRLPILQVVIRALKLQIGCTCLPLVISDSYKVNMWCIENHIDHLYFSNEKLGNRWNAGFKWFENKNVDFMLFLGSDDLISDNWCLTLIEYLNYTKRNIVGSEKFYMLYVDHNERKMCIWNGYKDKRKGYSVGAGRIITRLAMETIGWQPFDNLASSGLDELMQIKLAQNDIFIQTIYCDAITVMGVSSIYWQSKRNFMKQYAIQERMTNVETFLYERMPIFFSLKLPSQSEQ